MQPYPRSPDLVWPGHLHGTGCLSARAMDTGFPTVVWRLCLGLGCGWARVSAAPQHSWLGCLGVCLFACALLWYPATPGWGVRCGFVRLGPSFGCAPPLLAGVLGPVCVCVGAPPVPRHSWLGCAVWVCVLGLRLRLRPATPGWGVGACVCLCGCSTCTPPLLARVCGAGVCAWARVLAAPRHSWLGCLGLCVFVCSLRLYPATPGWGVRCGCVCWGSGFGCAPQLLAGVLGSVSACVRAPLVPRHSWLGCAAWVFVFGLGFRLHPATFGWGVGGVCVLDARSACAPPLLAGVCGVGACAWARVLAAPRHSWLGCWGVRVCVRAALEPRHSWLGCAAWVSCAWAQVSAAPRHSWPGCWGVCVLVWALRFGPATPCWGVRCGCACLGSGFWLHPATPGWGVGVCVCVCVLAPLVPRHSWLGYALWVGVLGLWFPLRPASPGWGVGVCVCVCVLAPLVPRHSWLGCALWVCVLVLGFRLRPATPGWGVGVCACLCALSACTPPLLAGVCGDGVRALARVSAAPRHSSLGCRGVCVLVCALRLYPATPGGGLWCVGLVLRGTCPCAVVRCVLCAAPGFAAPGGRCCLAPVRLPWLWPAACHSGVPCGPALVRRTSSGPVALSAPVGFPVTVVPFPGQGACAPGFTGWLRGARGGQPRTGLFVPAAGPRRGWGAGLLPRRTRSGPRNGVVPGGSLRRRSWAACAAVVGVCGPGH